MTTLGTQLFSNSFTQGNCRGREDEKLNLNKIPVKISDTNNGIISAGDMIKLVAGGSKLPTVVQVEETEEYSESTVYGFVPLARLKNQYENGDIATMDLSGCCMEMVAEEDIECGQQVAYDATTTTPANTGKIVVNPAEATAGIIPCGVALNDVAEGGLVRVLIK